MFVIVADGEAILIAGSVVSMVTVLPLVVAVAAEAAFPARSEKFTFRAATPLGSPAATVIFADQLVPLPVTVAVRPARVTTGVLIASFAVKLSVITSPTFAH